MLCHEELEHGAYTKPDFVMRVVRSYKTALSRQVGEAIRIQKRGGEGAILNSKAEFNRCQIPRLVVEEVDTEEQKKLEEQEVERLQELIERNREEWGSKKLKEREKELKEKMKKLEQIRKRTEPKKREQNEKGGAAIKRRKYATLPDSWGAEQIQNKEQGDSKLQMEPSLEPHVENQQELPYKEPELVEQPEISVEQHVDMEQPSLAVQAPCDQHHSWQLNTRHGSV